MSQISSFKEAWEKADFKEKMSWGMSMASQFSALGSMIDTYQADRLNADQAYTVSALELQALQQANQVRQQFINAMGNTIYGAQRRGVRVSSANVRDNLMRSSEALGKDVQTLYQNVQAKADVLRAREKMNKSRAKYGLMTNVLNQLSNIGATYVSLGEK